jgi:hypothetical protein
VVEEIPVLEDGELLDVADPLLEMIHVVPGWPLY